jgi:hypothetical protein
MAMLMQLPAREMNSRMGVSEWRETQTPPLWLSADEESNVQWEYVQTSRDLGRRGRVMEPAGSTGIAPTA